MKISNACGDGSCTGIFSAQFCIPAYVSLLKVCIRSRSLIDTRHLYTQLVHHGISSNDLLGNLLVVAFAKCGAIHDALHICFSLPRRTVISWSSIVCAYVECCDWFGALRSFGTMLDDGISPSATAFASVFKACGNVAELDHGRTLHAEALKRGITSAVFVGNTLVNMYGKCNAMEDAEVTFCLLPERNVVSWTAMLSIYIEQNQGCQALLLYRQMLDEDANSNLLTVSCVLKACDILANSDKFYSLPQEVDNRKVLEIGYALHAYARRRGFASNPVIGTTILCMYSKCKAILEAESAFNALSLQDIVAWNAMLSAYKNHGLEEETLLLYKHMQHEGLTPNQISFMIVLEACGNMAKRNYSYSSIALDIAYGLHSDIRKACYANDDFVNTALMSAYGNCGALMDVEMIFGALHVCSMATWTAMLRAYMDQGEVEKALSFYSQMQENIIVDDIMFLAILQLCSETGCLIYFKQTHYTIVAVGFDKIPFIVSSIITGYGSCASMLDGQATFAGFEEPTLESWNACIAGYSVVGKLSASFHILEELRMAGVRPDEATFVSVFVACSHCGRIRESFEYLWSMEKDYGLTPDVKHYTTSIDLLGRVGQLQKAMQLLKALPAQADSAAWSSLLGACCMHNDAMLAEIVFEYAARVHADQVDTYVLLSNVYALNKCAENVT